MVILSRGRSDQISTTELFPDFIPVLVPESEVDEYKKNIKNPILQIPDDVLGLGNVRNWVLKNFTEDIVVMIDDDIECCRDLQYYLIHKIQSDEIMNVIINTALMCKDANLNLFGFKQGFIGYRPTEPFSLVGWVGCVVGIVGRKFTFIDNKCKVDIDYSLQNLLVNREVLINNMYYFGQKMDNNIGGNSIFRSNALIEAEKERLKEKWGKYIEFNYKNKSNVRTSIKVTRKQKIFL